MNLGPKPIIKIAWCKACGLHVTHTHPHRSNYNTVSFSSDFCDCKILNASTLQ